jgi:molybdate transport system ATP-binding protein
MTLEVNVEHRLGQFRLEARFAAGAGLTALFGRSGSGKTSLVDLVAGLARPERGRIAVGGETVVDTAQRLFVPTHRRRVGYVFQEARLLPHLTVRQNLLYGRWFAGLGVGADPEIDRVVALLGLDHLLERRPRHLSGGERQRVAIGRALLAGPRILLMDEPLASLDEARKHEVMPFIERLRDEARVPIVYVSHSVPEVARLADTVVLLSEGRVVATGPTAEVLGRLDLFPLTGRSEAGAIVEAVVESHDVAYGITTLASRAGSWRVALVDAEPGTKIRLHVRSRDVTLSLVRPEAISALNVHAGRIVEIAGTGPVIEMRLDCNGDTLLARVTRLSADRLGLALGTPVFALVKSVAFDRRAVGTRSAGEIGDA